MPKNLLYIPLIILLLVNTACKKNQPAVGPNSDANSDFTSDSIEAVNELADQHAREIITVSEYNTDNPEIKNIDRPDISIIRNSKIDTTQLFGVWSQDPNGPHADFWLSKESFLVVDYDGDGHMPYILDDNEITIFYNDFIQAGTIISTANDTLKIKWSDFEKETSYVKFPK